MPESAPTAQTGAATAGNGGAPELAADAAARLDGFVASALGTRPTPSAGLDQERVDRIVWAMVVAGLRNAVELAQLAMEETGFGVFEDKVVKNYIATEFLFDYLKDKRSVGVIAEDPERGIQEVAEPIGVVLALTPITNPTSTVLFKSIVAAKTRNAIVFRPSARAARCAQRAVEMLQEAGEAAGLPPDALQVVPDPTLDVSQYLFHHPGVDFIWTTGGPKAVAAANEAGKPCISVGPGNAPVYIHRSADVRMAVVDMLISKTFDASVICPAEQTCVIDDAIWDETVAELERMGARLLDRGRGGPARRVSRSGRRQRADAGARAVLPQPGRDGRIRDGRARQGAARAASRRPGGAGPPPLPAREADARAGPRALAVGRARAARLRARDRARRARPHVRRLRLRRGGRAALRARPSERAASSSTRRPRWGHSAASTTR